MKKYTNQYLASFIDHAVLNPDMTIKELKENIKLGIQYRCKSVCVNPSAIDIAKECLKDSQTQLCVVCDFPFGTSHKESKIAQCQAIIDKGDIFEIDMVANYGLIKSQKYETVIDEISSVHQLCQKHGVGLKVIVETDALTKEEIIKALECCIQGQAEYIKTSTGFYKGEHNVGASLEVIQLLVNEAKGRIKVKGSGGVRSREKLIQLIELGIDRAGVGFTSTARILGDEYE